MDTERQDRLHWLHLLQKVTSSFLKMTIVPRYSHLKIRRTYLTILKINYKFI